MAADAAIEAEGLRKSYGDVLALDGVDLRVAAGTVLGLLGPNGAGKTTAVRILTTLLPPDGGSARVAGLDVASEAARLRRQIGLAGQYAAVDENLTGAENLEMVGRLYHLPRGEPRARAAELLDRFDLAGAADRLVRTYSGGMRRRLDLAAALVARPPVLFLDEPTTGLDPQARHLMWERLQLLLQRGKSILLTTHFMDEAERLCSRLLVLDHGRKIAEGRPRELIAQHLEPDVVEVYGVGAIALAHDAALRALAARVEVSGETVFFYTQNAHSLLQALEQHGHLRTLHRPANLEDLFLKLTGRQIREDG